MAVLTTPCIVCVNQDLKLKENTTTNDEQCLTSEVSMARGRHRCINFMWSIELI